jgi:hypothetical protein
VVSNLNKVTEAADVVLFSRRDTLKEKLMVQTRQKETAITELNNQINDMSFHEGQYQRLKDDRDKLEKNHLTL